MSSEFLVPMYNLHMCIYHPLPSSYSMYLIWWPQELKNLLFLCHATLYVRVCKFGKGCHENLALVIPCLLGGSSFYNQSQYILPGVSNRSVCPSVCHHHCHHENCQISTSRHLSDLKVQRICRSWRKTGSRMLRIEWHGLQASQIVYLVGYRSHTHQPCPLCIMHVISAHTHDWLGLVCVGNGRRQYISN